MMRLEQRLSIVRPFVPPEGADRGNQVRAVMTPLKAHDDVLAVMTEKSLIRVLQLSPLDPAYALQEENKAKKRLSHLNGALLREWHTTLSGATEAPFNEHVTRSVLEVLLKGMRGNLADRDIFIDALVCSIDREKISPPITAGAAQRIWLKSNLMPSHKAVIETCRAHREEVRRACAIVKKALALRANAEEVVTRARRDKWRQVAFDFLEA